MFALLLLFGMPAYASLTRVHMKVFLPPGASVHWVSPEGS